MVVKVGLDVTMVVVSRVVYHMGMLICLVNLVAELEMTLQGILLLVVVSLVSLYYISKGEVLHMLSCF